MGLFTCEWEKRKELLLEIRTTSNQLCCADKKTNDEGKDLDRHKEFCQGISGIDSKDPKWKDVAEQDNKYVP